MEFKQENTYILNLEGAYIYKAIDEENKEIKEGKKKGNKKIGYNTQKKKKDKDGKDTKENLFSFSKLYSATMPYSLETIRAFEKYPEEVLDNNGKQYTKLFINVNFEKHYKYEIMSESLQKKLAKENIGIAFITKDKVKQLVIKKIR